MLCPVITYIQRDPRARGALTKKIRRRAEGEGGGSRLGKDKNRERYSHLTYSDLVLLKRSHASRKETKGCQAPALWGGKTHHGWMLSQKGGERGFSF